MSVGWKAEFRLNEHIVDVDDLFDLISLFFIWMHKTVLIGGESGVLMC